MGKDKSLTSPMSHQYEESSRSFDGKGIRWSKVQQLCVNQVDATAVKQADSRVRILVCTPTRVLEPGTRVIFTDHQI